MKPTFLKILTGVAVVSLAFGLNSCKKAAVADDDSLAYNQSQADETFSDANNIADEAATTGALSYKTDDDNSLLAGCATVTRDTVANPHVATVDFGSGCTGADGRTRSGQIIVTYDGPYRSPGTNITITFNNYFVDGNQVLGTKTVHNNGLNSDGFLSYSVQVNGQLILANNGGTVTRLAQRTRVWIAGENTPSRDDDQYSITGSGSGTAANGDQFMTTILTPLIRDLAPGCRLHFVSGSVLLQRTNKPDRTINYGNGACDDIATVTVNGSSHTIHLH